MVSFLVVFLYANILAKLGFAVRQDVELHSNRSGSLVVSGSEANHSSDLHENQAAKVISDLHEEDQGDGPKLKGCPWFTWHSFKRYYFEFENQDGDRYAVVLKRDKTKPELIIHRNQKWEVQYYKDTKVLEWTPVDVDPEKEHDTVTMDLAQTEFIKYTDFGTAEDAEEPSVELRTQDGQEISFQGGLYFPEKLMKRAVLSRDPDEGKAATDGKLSAGNSAGRVGAVAVLTGSVSLGLGGAIGTAALAGVATGGALGLGVGAAVGAAGGVAYGVIHYRKQKREASLTMSQKLFEKLRCHPLLKQCGKTNVVVLKEGGECIDRESASIGRHKEEQKSSAAILRPALFSFLLLLGLPFS
eukprot:TRINITY_DN3897_c0_g2_i1.p1 TRINITY_DN3897_c0_g2~~TRINITY_DN3897_c0_g2_i1.p1  ORF type:complete len:357 (-),score=51.97 TRINITY_DN3897_c0_g2_i1:345-1415(-)